MNEDRSTIPYGTLDLLVLNTLGAAGPMHGFGIARRIEQMSAGHLELNQGSIYPALLRLRQRGWIAAEWGVSDNNRRAKFYSLTPAGRRQLALEVDSWTHTVDIVQRVLAGNS